MNIYKFFYLVIIIIIICFFITTILLIFCRDASNFVGIDPDKDKNIMYAFFIRFYFSVTTLSTTPYGDISPKSFSAKFISILTIIFIMAEIIYLIHNSIT